MQHRLTAVLAALLLVLGGSALAAEKLKPDESKEEAKAAEENTGAAPIMKLEKTQIDLGKITQGDEAVATFTIKNEGKGDLRILKAKPG